MTPNEDLQKIVQMSKLATNNSIANNRSQNIFLVFQLDQIQFLGEFMARTTTKMRIFWVESCYLWRHSQHNICCLRPEAYVSTTPGSDFE